MGKLRGLMDKMSHKEHEDTQDPNREDDNAFMHKTSHDTGADAQVKKNDGNSKAVY